MRPEEERIIGEVDGIFGPAAGHVSIHPGNLMCSHGVPRMMTPVVS